MTTGTGHHKHTEDTVTQPAGGIITPHADTTTTHLGEAMNDNAIWDTEHTFCDDWNDTRDEAILDGSYAAICTELGYTGSARFVAILGGAA